MKKWNLSRIMIRAWRTYRKGGITFGEALHRAWLSEKAEPINAERIVRAKAEVGVSEAVNTWAGWKALGREVLHGSKAVFQVDLIHGSKGDGAIYKASFFALSQTEAVA